MFRYASLCLYGEFQNCPLWARTHHIQFAHQRFRIFYSDIVW